jgi:O-antigen/teichoic acid export membrane protein
MPGASPLAGGITRVVVRGAGLAASGFVLGNAITLASYLVLARLVTPAEFGILAAGSVLVYFSANFVESGLAAALVRRRDRVDEAANTVFVATALAGAGFALLALAASPLVGRFFGSPHVTAVAAAMAGILFLRSLGIVPNTLLQMRFSFLRRVVVAPAGALAFGISAIAATASGWASGGWCSAPTCRPSSRSPSPGHSRGGGRGRGWHRLRCGAAWQDSGGTCSAPT